MPLGGGFTNVHEKILCNERLGHSQCFKEKHIFFKERGNGMTLLYNIDGIQHCYVQAYANAIVVY
jgi:hypothetical protein